jgi:hypothetical protein
VFATLRQRDFALLWVAGLISVAGNFAFIAALPLHAYRGRVFGSLRVVTEGAMLVGFVAAGVLGDAVSLVLVLSVSATIRMLGGIIALIFLPRDEKDATQVDIAESRSVAV